MKGTSTYQEIAEANSRRFVHLRTGTIMSLWSAGRICSGPTPLGIREIHCQHRRLNRDNQMVWMLLTIHLLADPDSGDVKALAYLKDINRGKTAGTGTPIPGQKTPYPAV